MISGVTLMEACYFLFPSSPCSLRLFDRWEDAEICRRPLMSVGNIRWVFAFVFQMLDLALGRQK